MVVVCQLDAPLDSKAAADTALFCLNTQKI